MGIFSWLRRNRGGGGNVRPEPKYEYIFGTDGNDFTNININSLIDPGVAGQHGILEVVDGAFQFQDGTSFKIYGASIGKDSAGPSKVEANRIAKRIAALGFNCIRFHIIDTWKGSAFSKIFRTDYNRSWRIRYAVVRDYQTVTWN